MHYKNALIVFLFSAILYSITISAPFVSDEISFITRNKIDNAAESLSLFEKKDYDGYYYRPLPNFISGIVTLFFDYKYPLYRIFNAIIHGLNASLIFLLGLQLFRGREDLIRVSFWGALLWGAFPIHDYAVIWHTDLFDRLMALFLLAALLFYSKRKMLLSLLFFMFGILSKEAAFTFPLVIFLYNFLLSDEAGELKKGVIKALPFVGLVFLFVFLRIILFDNNIFTAEDAHSGRGVGVIIRNLGLFGGVLVFPFFLRETESLLYTYWTLFYLAGIAGLAGSMIYLNKRRSDKIIIFLLLFIIISIIPASRLFMRWYLYFPSIGFTLLISYIIISLDLRVWIKNLLAGVLLLLYTTSVIVKEIEWVKQAKLLDKSVSRFAERYGPGITEAGSIVLLTAPSKVNDVPIMNLGVQQHLNHYLGTTDLEVDVVVHSFLEGFNDSIEYKLVNDNIEVRHKKENYFLLSGNKKNVKFGNKDSKDGRIRSVEIELTEDYRRIYTFTNGYFIQLQGSLND
jgi:hypothetical protein